MGRPAASAPNRPRQGASLEEEDWATMTSSMRAGSSLDRSSTDWMTCAHSAAALKGRKAPPKAPMGVRKAETMAARRKVAYSYGQVRSFSIKLTYCQLIPGVGVA